VGYEVPTMKGGPKDQTHESNVSLACWLKRVISCHMDVMW
jgi:hypothetical protein